MARHTLHPCAVIFCTALHEPVAAALRSLCELEGLKVYLLEDPGADIVKCFDQIRQDGGRPVLVVHGGGAWRLRSAMECTIDDLESAWRSICHAGSLIGQEAIRAMRTAGSGTLLFLGHVSSTQVQAGCAAHGAANAGLRSFAQSMAREFGPQGIHVVYAKLGGIPGERAVGSAAKAIALACWQLHLQHSSTWTHEIDLSPAGSASFQCESLA